MNIVVLNGSPKGDVSVTMQYVRYLQEVFPQHQMTIHNIAQQLPKLERDPDAFGAIVEAVRAADGVLWAFPLYYFAVHGNYKRFIELIWERGAQEAFRGKYAASLSTSIHFYDHAAHAYIEAICDDLEMRYVSAFPAAMQDLLRPEGRAQLQAFGRDFFAAIEAGLPTQRSYAPLRPRAFAYVPGPAASQAPRNGRRILIVTDAQPAQANLIGMVERFAAAWDGPVEVINLHQVDIKGGCLGCIRCGPDNECAYAGKDGFIDFYNDKVRAADILVFAGAIKDRYLSSRWKTFFDRSFFKTHTPTLIGKQIAFIISGPLSQIAPLREVLQAWVEIERANLVGFITDEEGDAAEIDGRLDGLARRLAAAAAAAYVRPQSFLGVGGMKVFRDDVWGPLRLTFYADHRAYRKLGLYDFPQRNWSQRLANFILIPLLRIPPIKEQFRSRTREGMVVPYKKVVDAAGSEAP